ncbi:MAG: mitochondrial import inner membrane translocase subunit tim54 [Icmadophila ericetorum]|nr:mitochondrial import inner membrane translocase subunit tim54 [Icmadophila ericetorum]
MADNGSKPTANDVPLPQPVTKPRPQSNPVFMGLPRFRARLPSRNWSIFLSITGSFTSALLYDRYQKKQVQRKWCKLVSHISQESLPVNQLPRKITVFLSAPPGDGLRSAREYFQEYVKPVLVAAAMDWDVVEGRKEGQVRAELGERIRKIRERNGELPQTQNLEEDPEDLVEKARRGLNVRPWDGLQGDLVIGRHTWKEYIRGLHEGWLGPLDPPPEPPLTHSDLSPITETQPLDDIPKADPTNLITDQPFPEAHITEIPTEAPSPLPSSSESPPSTESPPPPPAEPEKKKPPSPVPPFILPSQYPTSTLAPTIPCSLPPSTALPLPHILGFLNTPIRIKRFLTRRYLADEVGRDVAALVLAAQTRPYTSDTSFASSIDPDSPSSGTTLEGEGLGGVVESGKTYEQQSLLAYEEKEWHKSVYKTPAPVKDSEGKEIPVPPKERPWLEPIILDERVASKMSTFQLAPGDESLAKEIAKGKYDEVDPRSWAQKGKDTLWRVGVFMDFVEGGKEGRGRFADQGLIGGEDE